MKLLGKIKKYYEYFATKLKVKKNQKTFSYEGIDVHYMKLGKADSRNLVIVFSACTRPGLPARYNYVKTLNGANATLLFILDDFNTDKRGSYYLGRMPEFPEEKATQALIDKIIDEQKPEKVLFAGSCKGGYAAMNFGSRYEHSYMIIGEPTYRIATEFALADSLMTHWMGEISDENKEFMDNYLAAVIAADHYADSQKMYLLYSDKDEYFEKHTTPFLEDIRYAGFEPETEVKDFAAHADLGIYFAGYLKTKIDAICKE